jgi:hypothetical protein
MDDKKKSRVISWLLVLLPLWLIVSGGFALMRYFHKEAAAPTRAENRFAKRVSTDSVADDLEKLISVVGERNTGKPDQLAATASMIEGTLGPSNTGYKVSKIKSPSDFPIIKVTIDSPNPSAEPIWILTSYDSPDHSRGAEKNATGLAATLAAAQSLADFCPACPIHFIFIPHVNENDAPILETAITASKLIQSKTQPRAVLCIEAMGDAESLIFSSRDTSALSKVDFEDLGKIAGAEVVYLGDGFDLSSALYNMNLAAIRISTRPTLLPSESDEKTPFAPTLAASAERLIELIRRLSK